MKETRFIAQNKEKWLESEALLNDPLKDPEKLSTLFTQVVDDLSYSRTYYRNRTVRVYLNKIATEYFSIIYSHKKSRKNNFKLFWTDELPQIVYHSRKQILISLFVFLLAAGIGIFSSLKDPQFTSTILGEDYVAMTKENIANGDPMAVYKKSHQVDMFLGITLNNLMVAFRTYVFGIFLSIGTIAILLYNGIMVGCFQFFFIERGLFAESALSIWLHGTLEISSIILAGGAGLVLGSGLIFPGTYSRLQAFQMSGIRSLKLMLGITPIIVLAAIIESLLTRYTEIPDILKLLLILLSASFIICYFVVYPWLKSKSGFAHPLVETKLPPDTKEIVTYNRIKNNAEILKDTFHFYKKYANKLLPWVLIITLFMTVAKFLFNKEMENARLFREWWQYFLDGLLYALSTPSPMFVVINALGTSLIVGRALALVDGDAKNISTKVFVWRTLLQTILIMTIAFFIKYSMEGWGTFIVIFSFAFFLVFVFTQLTEKTNLLKSFARTWSLCAANFGQVLGLQLILQLLSFSFLIILSAPLIYMNTTILEWNFAKSDVWAQDVIHFVELFIKIAAFNLILPILAIGAAYLYFSLSEVASAYHLKESITKVGSKFSKNRR